MRRKAQLLIAAMVLLGAPGASASQVEVAQGSAGGREQPPAERASATELATIASVHEVCLATRPVKRVFFDGDEPARTAARRDYSARRQKALANLYRMRIPSGGFSLGPTREAEEEVPLVVARGWRTQHGAVTLAVPRDMRLSFVVPPGEAARARQAVASGEAVLEVFFELSDDLGAVCSGSVAAGVYVVNVRPAAVELRGPKSELLARLETARADLHRDILGGFSGVPAASIGAVTVAGTTDGSLLRQRLTPLQEPLRRCYTRRLAQRPGAAGTIIVGVEVARNGRVSGVDFIADASGDEGLRRCVEDVFGDARLSGMPGLPLLFRVPVEFKRIPR